MIRLCSFLACAMLASAASLAAGDALAQAAAVPAAAAPAVTTPPAAMPGAAPGTAILAPAVAPLVRLDPTEVRSRPTLAQGCWVWLFPQKNYQGKDDIAIAGPAAIRSLHTPIGLDWKQKTESLIVGPKATVTVYETNEFGDRQAVFKPGTRVKSLRKTLRFTQSIDSLKIACPR